MGRKEVNFWIAARQTDRQTAEIIPGMIRFDTIRYHTIPETADSSKTFQNRSSSSHIIDIILIMSVESTTVFLDWSWELEVGWIRL